MRKPKNPDRLPPSSPEAEAGVLACVLLDPSECFPKAQESIKDPAAFYDPRYRTIWTTVTGLAQANRAIDTVTLTEALKVSGELENVGGMALISTLPEQAPTTHNLQDYLTILREKLTLRKIIADCTELVGEAFETSSVNQVLDRFVNVASNHIAGRDHTGIRHATSKEACKQAMDQIQWRTENPNKLSGIPTGYHHLDRLTDGLQRGELALICARPSQGKSAALLNLTDNICLKQGIPTLFFSLEMSIRAMMQRLICGSRRIDSMRMRKGQLTPQEVDEVMRFTRNFGKHPLYFAEGDMSIGSLMRIARDYKRRHDIKFIVVDYLQKVGPATKNEKRTYEVATVSNGLKELAKELDVPVLSAVQLNRESEIKLSRPVLSNIGDSGQIERDADLCVMVYHHQDQPTPDVSSVCEWIVAKQREGPTGDIAMVFLKEFTRFEERGFGREGT